MEAEAQALVLEHLRKSLVINFRSAGHALPWFLFIKEHYSEKLYAAHIEIGCPKDPSFQNVKGQNARAVCIFKEQPSDFASIAEHIVSHLDLVGVDASNVSHWYHGRDPSYFPPHQEHIFSIEHVFIFSNGISIYGDYSTENTCTNIVQEYLETLEASILPSI